MLGCCLGIPALLPWAPPALFGPSKRSTFPPDILSEPAFENVKSWDDPRLLAEIDKRERENTRSRNGSRSSLGVMIRLMLLLADLGLVLGMDRFGINLATTFEARADTLVAMVRRG